jgi:hypothetical protein
MNYAGFLQLAAKSGNARARYFGEPGVICIGDIFEEPLDTTAPNRRDDPELSENMRGLN